MFFETQGDGIQRHITQKHAGTLRNTGKHAKTRNLQTQQTLNLNSKRKQAKTNLQKFPMP